MNICVITPDYPSQGYPVYTFVEQLCVELAKQGCKVSVISPQNLLSVLTRKRHKVDFIRNQRCGNGEITVYSPFTITGYSVPVIGKWINKVAGCITRRYMHKHIINPDVYYSHFWRAGLWTYQEAKRNGKPLFVASGESSIALKNNARYIDEYCKYVKGVICVSTKNKNESINNGLTTAEKCIVIPNAIDNSLFYVRDKQAMRRKYGFNPEDFIVAFVGYFCERKGSKRVSNAIKKLYPLPIKSIFIGSVRDQYSQPDCEGILFTGSLPHDQIPDYLNCADVFVLPTLKEGCCNAIIEAMACGLPIISSDKDFNEDILDDSCSILVDPSDEVEIANAIKNLFDDNSLRERLSRGALLITKNLTIKSRARKILDFIRTNL